MRDTYHTFAVAAAVLGALLITPLGTAQTQSVTKFIVLGGGVGVPRFRVDGVAYSQQASFLWPKGSTHSFSVDQPTQLDPTTNTMYAYAALSWKGTDSQGNGVGGSTSDLSTTITADPAITEYDVGFTSAYLLQVLFFPCDPGSSEAANGPGIVTIGGLQHTCDYSGYMAGSITIQATPKPGYIFTGYSNPGGQAIAGFQTTVTMTGPQIVFPNFAPTRTVNFATSPPGLAILADHTSIVTPYALQWGMGTVHALAPVSPQMDATGHSWVFASWSDNGAAVHAYTVPVNVTPDVVTANYNPALGAIVMTSPAGLKVTVDGATGAGGTFTWGLGETHTLNAPAQQTDATGHVWQFSGWSNGGAQAQSITVSADDIPLGMRLVATFTPVGHLTVTTALPGVSFTVNGSVCASPCDMKQAVGTQVTVSAPASVALDAGSREDLAGWTGGPAGGPGPVTLTLGNDPVTLTAVYRLMHMLTLGGSPLNSVRFTMQPASGDGFYADGTSVAVSAAPNPGFKFRNWTGDLTGAIPTGIFSMGAAHSAMAVTTPVPYIPTAGVVNAAGITPQMAVAPGSIVSIFGVNLAATTVTGPSAPLSQTLAGITVSLSGKYLPLIFASPSQINFQLPADTPLGGFNLVVSSVGQPDVDAAVTVVADAPGLFQQVVDGKAFAVAVHPDGSAVTADAPAAIGEQITLYGTGFGPTNPVRPFGFPVPAGPVYAATDAVNVTAGGADPVAGSAFALAGAVGIDAVQFTLTDQTLSGGSAAVTVTVGGQGSNVVLLPIK
jgi:uncharacterized protein (TIGR03437 family)